jgi:hypothetical protein
MGFNEKSEDRSTINQYAYANLKRGADQGAVNAGTHQNSLDHCANSPKMTSLILRAADADQSAGRLNERLEQLSHLLFGTDSPAPRELGSEKKSCASDISWSVNECNVRLEAAHQQLEEILKRLG